MAHGEMQTSQFRSEWRSRRREVKESPLRVSGQETQENRDMDRDRPRGKLTSICGALGSADGRKKSSNL